MTVYQEMMIAQLRKMAAQMDAAGMPDIAKVQRAKADQIEKAGQK